MEVSLQDAILLERVVDPNSHEFKELLGKLVRKVDEGVTRAEKLNKIGADTKFVLPYRGDSDTELDVESRLPVRFSDRGVYRNGAASLAFSAADLLDLIAQSSGRRRMTASLVVSAEHSSLREATVSAGSASSVIYYCGRENLYSQCASLADKLETMIFDHTTVNMPVDELLNFAYHVGARVVDGVFPYHVAARRGWDTVAGLGKWSYTHSNHHIVIGPDDDPSRLLKYERGAYMKFLEPSTWRGL
jgi:hypothetical protein